MNRHHQAVAGKPFLRQFADWFRHQSRIILNSILPNSCFLCGRKTDDGAAICPDCETLLPFSEPACQRCALPLPGTLSPSSIASTLMCGECISDEPAFSLSLAPLLYRKPVSTWISAFKYRARFREGHVLSSLLAKRLEEYYAGHPESLPEVILPVPVHWKRRLTRGFNQTEIIASHLARQLDIAVDKHLLVRQHFTPRQQQLGRVLRHKNLRSAFRINSGRKHYQRVAVLDDVITTGATIREISRLLQNSGVKEIHVWAIARTPRKRLI